MNAISLAGPRGVQRLPAGGWLALQGLALWPHAQWAAARMMDGSDDPLGAAALAVLALLLLRHARELRDAPRPGWFAAGAAFTLAATVALWWLPPLAAALLAALALGCGLAAWLPAGVPRLPLMGLALLALPVIASLQFYAGYPLRVLTAEASTWLLQAAGFAAERSGAAMTVNGRLVIVDAPCSGVQLAWFGYFCAFGTAAWQGLRDGVLLRRLPGVALLVLTGNVLRNALLVGLEAGGAGVSEAVHQGIGYAALVMSCGAVLWWMTREEENAHALSH